MVSWLLLKQGVERPSFASDNLSPRPHNARYCPCVAMPDYTPNVQAFGRPGSFALPDCWRRNVSPISPAPRPSMA